jgi:hypothetical protein
MTMDTTSANAPFFDFVISEGMSSFEAALEYFRNGRKPVFTYGIEGDISTPEGLRCVCNTDCGKNAGKHPIRKNWPKPAETEEALRDEFLSIRAKSNVGLILGEQRDGSYLVAVDVDDEPRVAQLELELGFLPRDTATCESARGYRLFYRIPEIVPKARLKNRTALSGKPRENGEKQERIPGVDVKVGGGQVVVAPSLHISGKRYVWSKLGEVLTLPVAWCEPLLEDVPPPRFLVDYTPDTFAQDEKAKKKAAAYLQKAVTEEAARLAYMPEGMRNDYLYRKAIRLLALANSSYSVGKWEYVLRQLENAATFAGLTRTEVRRTLASAERYVVQNNIVSGPRPLPVYDKPDPESGSSAEPSREAPRVEVVSEEPPPAPPIELIQDKGAPAAIAENVARLLGSHPNWRGGPGYDVYSDRIYWPSPRPNPVAEGSGAYTKVDRIPVQAWCVRQGVRVGADTTEEGIRVAARRRSFDSLQLFVENLPEWDGQRRIDTWLTTYLGCKDTKYHRATGRSWLRACIERALMPGLLVDIVPVLQGLQRVNKNYALNTLFYSDRMDAPWISIMGKFDPDKLDLQRASVTRWIIHDDEFKARDPKRLDAIKSWISKLVEQYIAKYENDHTVRPRRALLVCSTNDNQYFYDPTGNRRWLRWEVGVAGKVDIDLIARDRLQLFAEAKISDSWRTGLDYDAIENEAEKARIVDPLRDRLLRLANEPLAQSDGTFRPLWLGWQTADVLAEWLRIPSVQADQGFAMRLGRAVSDIKGTIRKTGRGAGSMRFYRPPPMLDFAQVAADLADEEN